MTMPTREELPHLLDLPDLPTTTFSELSRDQVARLAGLLKPLPWIDGLVTALLISPDEEAPEGWSDFIWADDALDDLTDSQADEASMVVIGHFTGLGGLLIDRPEEYQPFLGDNKDDLAAAAQWAAGFRFGIRLHPEPWAPLIDDDEARRILGLIFCLERDEDMGEEERAQHPLGDLPAPRRETIRRESAPLLRVAVLVLSHFSSMLNSELDEAEPFYVRSAPKIGRNEPCPCGSGRKYKKCCLDQLEH